MYHNIRDKFGRFAKKKATNRKKATAPKKTEKKTILSVFVLDDSASMASKQDVTINGFNELLTHGRLDGKKNNVIINEKLVTFGEHNNEKWFDSISELTPWTYRPDQGWTALYDAIGFAIKKTELLLTKLPKNTQVLISIFTDGYDNNSKIWNPQSINSRIKEVQQKDWTVTFIGAGSKEQIERVAHDIGVYASNTMNYTNNVAGTQTAFATVSSARSAYTTKVAKGAVVTDGFFGL